MCLKQFHAFTSAKWLTLGFQRFWQRSPHWERNARWWHFFQRLHFCHDGREYHRSVGAYVHVWIDSDAFPSSLHFLQPGLTESTMALLRMASFTSILSRSPNILIMSKMGKSKVKASHPEPLNCKLPHAESQPSAARSLRFMLGMLP